MRTSLTTFFSLLLVFGFCQFESKKQEKLYYALDDAYLEYDYQVILDAESDIQVSFLSSEDTLAANMYAYLGEAYYYELGELQQALDYYNLELDLRKKIQPNEAHTTTVFSIANIQLELGYYQKAESLLKEVVQADAKQYGKKSEEYFTSAMGLVDLYMRTEDSQQGLREASDLRKHVKGRPYDEAVVLKTIGDLYEIDGSFKKSERFLFEALALFEENGLDATFEYAATLNSLATLYSSKGKLPDSEEVYQEAISILERMQGENEDAIGGIKGNLSRVYFDLGNYEEAIEMQQQVATESEAYFGEESFDYGIALLNLSRSQMYARQHAEAEKNLLDALVVFEKSSGKESLDYGRAESMLAFNSTRRGYIDEAIRYGKSAINTVEKALGEDHPELAFPLSFLADAYMGYEQLDEAEPLIKRAYDIRRKQLGKRHPQFAKSANQQAVFNWKKGDVDAALKFYKETFDNYFDQINAFFPVLTEEEKASFYYTNLKPGFEQYVSFIEDNASENSALLGEIYDYQLALKGLIFYTTTKVRQSILDSGDEVLIAQFEEWISQKEQLAKFFSRTDLEVAVRNKKIDSLTTLSNELEAVLTKSSASFNETLANRNSSWKDIRAKLSPGEAAVEMIRYRDFVADSSGVFTDEVHYAAMIIQHDSESPNMVILRNGQLMETKYLANYRNAIKYKVKENYSYNLFWRPIANRLEGIKKVYFSPDGVYNQISIYSLRNPDTNDYLINELDIQMMTNTKDLINPRQPGDGNASVFFGYPNYNMGSAASSDETNNRGLKRGSRGLRSGKKGSLRGVTIPRGIRGNLIRYMRSTNGMALLPGTKREVEIIDSLYTSSSADAAIYLSDQAIEDEIKNLKSPSVLHIATHGFFLELDPDAQDADQYVENPLLRSGLILAGANTFIREGQLTAAQSEEDGILTAFEAMNLRLDDTDIVILSACETGLGEIKNGEGVYGLQRAFQIAGADALIMSMWSVDDNSTQELMTNFYEEWLTHGDKHQAFIVAQQRLKEKYPNPFYWGAFVMLGK